MAIVKSTMKKRYVCARCGDPHVSVEAFVHWDQDTQDFEVSEVCDKGHQCDHCGETRLARIPYFEGENVTEFANYVLGLLHFTPEWSADTLDQIGEIASALGFVDRDCADFKLINTGD